MLPMLTHEHLVELVERPGPWVTLSMPLSGGGPLAKGDPIRYRNLVRSVSEQLDAQPADRDRRDALMAPLEALGDRHDVFSAGARGLVVFVSPGGAEHWHLPVELEEVAHVGDRPFLEPLIPIVTDSTHFYVVALSQHAVRLLECDRFTVRALPLPEGTPTRLEDAAGWEIEQDSLQMHDIHPGPLLRWSGTSKLRVPSGSAGNRPIFHGHGAGKDDTETDLARFVRELDPGLWAAITHRGSPVVLAATEALQPVFRTHTRLPNVIEPYLRGSVEHLSDAELHARALALVTPLIEQRVEDAKARYHEIAGTGRALDDARQVALAAADGIVDTLFVRRSGELRAVFDPRARTVELGDAEGAVDLLDRAATDTFLSGGTVHRLDADRMPVEGELAAILRY